MPQSHRIVMKLSKIVEATQNQNIPGSEALRHKVHSDQAPGMLFAVVRMLGAGNKLQCIL